MNIVKWQAILTKITTKLEVISGVEGVFLSGSLVNQDQDDFSDIDLGVATKNSARAFDEVCSLRHQLIGNVGQPIQFLEREWGHCQMIAALYGKSQFPPVGLEVDIIFSQLQHVAEQMPWSEYKILFDRSGQLQPALAEVSQPRPNREVEKEIARHLSWFPFYVHDAVKACRREDQFQAQSLLEEIRKLIFFAAAAREGGQVYGAKRASRYLSPSERQHLEQSYRQSDESTVAQLTQIYLACLTELQVTYQIADNVEVLKSILQELL